MTSRHSDRPPSRSGTPFLELPRSEWASLAESGVEPLTEPEIAALRGLGEALDLREVAEVYVPLSRLVNLYAAGAKSLGTSTAQFLRTKTTTTPFVIGIAGSVAVGKSTSSRLLRELLGRWESTPRVELVTTDGFLFPNAELERRGLMHRKGFPESYDRRALLRFVSQVKSGVAEVAAPVYSHLVYDIVPGEQNVVHCPDILIIEGLNVLQPPAPGSRLALSDLFDFAIYVDARTSDIEEWFVERFRGLFRGALKNPESYFHRFTALGEDNAVARAREVWKAINEPNLVENILPTRARADLVLRKAADHTVSSVLIRKI